MTPPIFISKDELSQKIASIQTNPDERISIIFGAGASYGYSNDLTFQAPIVRKLFSRFNLVVKNIIDKAEHSFVKNNSSDFERAIKNHNNDLEEYLSTLYSQNNEDNIFGNFLIYLEDLFFFASNRFQNDVNYYRMLINRMWNLHGKKQWSLISFNYDTILEQSYLLAGRDPRKRTFKALSEYHELNPVLIKMHGSINFRYIYGHLFEDGTSKLSNHELFSLMMAETRKSEIFINIGF